MNRDLTCLKERWRTLLCQQHANLAQAQKWLRSLLWEPDQICLWTDLPDPGDVYARDKTCFDSYNRVEDMAVAYAAHESALQGDPELRNAIAHALSFLSRCWYNREIREGGEWWYKEIGIPLRLNRILLMMQGQLDEAFCRRCLEDMYSFISEPEWMVLERPETSTGANRVWKCLALAGSSVLMDFPAGMDKAQKELADVFAYTEAGDGFYRDGSFVQHQKFAYNGGYGLSLLEVIVDYMELVKGSAWSVSGEQLQMLLAWVEQTYEPFLVGGALMDLIRGREIARERAEEHKSGHQMICALLRLADSLPDAQSLPLRRKLKRWILDDHFRPFVQHAPLRPAALAQSLLADETIEPWDFEPRCMIFAGMDRVVHRRNGWTAALSMCSSRIGRYESIHDENVRGWYQADGRLYLYTADQGQYSQHYHPTVNACRLAGITVEKIQREETGVSYGKEPKIQMDWAGGVQVDGLYGAAAMELTGEAGKLHAHKAWFFFMDEIVCLGAGISGAGSVETVVENRRIPLDGNIRLLTDGTQAACGGQSGSLRWMHLQTSGDQIGYVFPEACPVEWTVASRTGSWYQINRNTGDRQEHTNRFAEIVISHGSAPKNGDYQYILLPRQSAGDMQAYADALPVRVLANTAELQAVQHAALGLIGAHFWREGCTGPLSCSAEASVMTHKHARRLALAVSDPAWRAKKPVTLQWDEPAQKVLQCDTGIRVLQLEPFVLLEADLRGTHGQSMQVSLQMY